MALISNPKVAFPLQASTAPGGKPLEARPVGIGNPGASCDCLDEPRDEASRYRRDHTVDGRPAASRKSLWAPYVVLMFSLRPGRRLKRQPHDQAHAGKMREY